MVLLMFIVQQSFVDSLLDSLHSNFKMEIISVDDRCFEHVVGL